MKPVDLKAMFELKTPALRRIGRAVRADMDAGLRNRRSTLLMLPAFCDAATGREKGRYLALDLGGTNFRVMMVRLAGRGRKPAVLAEAKYKLTHDQITGEGRVLFNAIAGYVKVFLRENGFSGRYGLGYTFSFPVKLLGIDEGILLRWTKGFTARGVVGGKVVALQKAALARRNVASVDIRAVANDTVGTLQARAIRDPGCVMGVILGTGFNICLRLPVSRIRKSIGAYGRSHMIINMEAGGFGRGLPRTAYDRRLDRASKNPGAQRAEKMISGKYLPLLVREIVLDLVKREKLFGGKIPEIFRSPDGFKAHYMDILECGSAARRRELAGLMLGRAFTPAERATLKTVCHVVAQRSARIAAALMSAALSRAVPADGGRGATIAVDGSLFEKYPGYEAMLKKAMGELAGARGRRAALELTKDGSGIGAAIIAAVAGT